MLLARLDALSNAVSWHSAPMPHLLVQVVKEVKAGVYVPRDAKLEMVPPNTELARLARSTDWDVEFLTVGFMPDAEGRLRIWLSGALAKELSPNSKRALIRTPEELQPILARNPTLHTAIYDCLAQLERLVDEGLTAFERPAP
jgi:hypothetical protein